MTQIIETVEMYTARREREIFEERLITAKIQKERNYAVLRAKFSRFGTVMPLPRSQQELEVIAQSEREILGTNTQSNNADNMLKSAQSNTVIDEKEPISDMELLVTANTETGDIVQLLHKHFNLGGSFLNEGAFFSATEISRIIAGGTSANLSLIHISEPTR